MIDAAQGTLIESAEYIYAWSTSEEDISIDFGEYSINGGEYTSNAGKILYGDKVKVRVLSSSSGSTKVTANLTIGSQTSAFEVTTVV